MLLGKRVYLRAIEEKDLPYMILWRNDPRVNQYFFDNPSISLVMQKQWFENLLKDTREVFWIIENISTGESIGMISLSHIDLRNRKAELGHFLLYPPEKYKGKGYGKEVEELVLEYGFNYLGLNRIQLEIFTDNESVINMHKKFGFKIEGTFKQYVFKDGKFRDVYFMTLLREDR